jgi:hypothetical protein
MGSRGYLVERNFSELELRRDIKTTTYATSPWRRNIVIGSRYIRSTDALNGWKKIIAHTRPLDRAITDKTRVNEAHSRCKYD